MHKTTASTWFASYNLTLVVWAVAGVIILILTHDRHPAPHELRTNPTAPPWTG
jgi:hypothetical protein